MLEAATALETKSKPNELEEGKSRLHVARNIKIASLVIGLAVACLSMAFPIYQTLKINALRTEAKVMLAYMQTLQKAYHTDKGRYVSFEQYYGAPLNGKLNCERPAGAKELGFVLKGCDKDPARGGLRFTYRATFPNGDASSDFRGEALSGSSVDGESFICLGAQSSDVWTVSPSAAVRHSKMCE